MSKLRRNPRTIGFLKRLSYWRPIRRAARALHLSPIARKWYFRWACPEGGILRLACGGISANFYVRTSGELRLLESMGGGGGEQPILEALFRALRPGDVVYDIGSSVGLYTVFLSKVVGDRGQVIAFEPEAESHAQLQENIELNRLGNVRSFRMACGDCSGELTLYRGEQTGNFSLVQPYTGMIGDKVIVVEGDRLVEEKKLPLPRAVKIDVEGYEYAVLCGLRHTLAQATCDLICCEIHPDLLPAEVKPEDVLTLVKSLGFSRVDHFQNEGTYHALCYKALA